LEKFKQREINEIFLGRGLATGKRFEVSKRTEFKIQCDKNVVVNARQVLSRVRICLAVESLGVETKIK
jgi:hypothetical protein